MTEEEEEDWRTDIPTLSFKFDEKSQVIFATYAPSHDNNITFFNDLRRSQLQCYEDYQIIIADLNTTLDTKMDKLGYNCDNHWSE